LESREERPSALIVQRSPFIIHRSAFGVRRRSQDFGNALTASLEKMFARDFKRATESRTPHGER
jgi:hypothetical protein